MCLNARQSPNDSFIKIRPNDNRAKFPENSKTANKSTKFQPVNLSGKSGDTAGVHQRLTDSLLSF